MYMIVLVLVVSPCGLSKPVLLLDIACLIRYFKYNKPKQDALDVVVD